MKELLSLLVLTEEGKRNLKKSVAAACLKRFSLMIPILISAFVMHQMLQAMSDETSGITADLMWAFAVGTIGAAIMLIAVKHAYWTNHIPTYHEEERLMLSVAEHLRKLPMDFYNTHSLADLSETVMADCSVVERALSNMIPDYFASVVSIPVFLLILACIQWWLAAAMAVSIPAAFAVQMATLKYQAHLSEIQVKAKHEATNRIQEYIEGIKTIKAFGIDEAQSSSLKSALKALHDTSMRMELTSGVFVAGASAILHTGVGFVIGLGAWMLTGSKVDFLTVMLFAMIVLRIYEPVGNFLSQLSNLAYMKVSLKRLKELLSYSVAEEKGAAELKQFDIMFDHVNFGYQENCPVLKDLTMTIPQGKITALVGPSGSGKSTAAQLAAGFWKPNSGCISVGGTAVSDLNMSDIGKNISVVFQDVTLFHDTIFNNILIGRPDATAEEVEQAARAAQCMDFLNRLPDGIHTIIAENGKSLSGGERQRISIARAILKNAPILLLDEPTASLDPENVLLVQDALSALVSQGKTVLIIAHHLRSVCDADQILVLDSGILVECGTHEELMQKNGRYAGMYRMQEASMNWTVC